MPGGTTTIYWAPPGVCTGTWSPGAAPDGTTTLTHCGEVAFVARTARKALAVSSHKLQPDAWYLLLGAKNQRTWPRSMSGEDAVGFPVCRSTLESIASLQAAGVLLARYNHLRPRTTGQTAPTNANSPADSTPSCRAFSLPESWALGTVSQPPRSLAELTPRPPATRTTPSGRTAGTSSPRSL